MKQAIAVVNVPSIKRNLNFVQTSTKSFYLMSVQHLSVAMWKSGREEGEINAPQAGNAFRRKGGPGSGKTEHFLSLQHIPPFFSVCFTLRAANALRILFLLLNVFILY